MKAGSGGVGRGRGGEGGKGESLRAELSEQSGKVFTLFSILSFSLKRNAVEGSVR